MSGRPSTVRANRDRTDRPVATKDSACTARNGVRTQSDNEYRDLPRIQSAAQAAWRRRANQDEALGRAQSQDPPGSMLRRSTR